jgi:DNA-binding NtrC family response regulator
MARILLAEDDLAVRSFVSRALEQRGHEVTAVNDGSQALAALENDDFDLLITDIVMPEMDGIALSIEVSSRHPDVPILMMTGFSAERQRAHEMNEFTHPVITKPFSLNDICAAAERCLGAKLH